MFKSFLSRIINSPKTDSPLKTAFQQSRKQQNIELILPAFLDANLFVVCGSAAIPGKPLEYFLPSPQENRFCVTVSERIENLSNIAWPKEPITGHQLLKTIQPGWEIVIVYADGGDYISQEHLEWYRKMQSS
jgi:fimbrial chaperone protein